MNKKFFKMKVTISIVVLLVLSIQLINCYELTSGILSANPSWSNWYNTTNGTVRYDVTAWSKNITSINSNAFKYIKNFVTRITLSSNKLTSINPAAFEGLDNLKTLELHSNQLSALTLPYLPSLEYLHLSNNLFRKV